MATYDGFLIATSGVVASSAFLYKPGLTFNSFAFMPSVPSVLIYRMRGYDTTLTTTVFWGSDHVDAAADDYGGPGPVIDIVIHKKLGTT